MLAHGYKNALDLARKAGVPHSVLSKFFAGKRGLGVETRRKLASVFPGSAHLLVADIVSANGSDEAAS